MEPHHQSSPSRAEGLPLLSFVPNRPPASPLAGTGDYNEKGQEENALSILPSFLPLDTASSRRSFIARSPWTPWILRPATIIIFVLSLLASIGALEALIRLSRARDGFTIPSTSIHGSMTYVPVVLTVLFGWLWKSYDVEIKKLVPWAAMEGRSCPASDSLLLDYVGKNPASAMVQAVRKRHWSILLAAIGSLLVIVANVAAASLWTIETKTSTFDNVRLTQSSKYDLATFNGTLDDLAFLYKYLAGITYSLPYPDWTTAQWAITPFASEAVLNGESTQVLGQTDAFSASLSCEEVSVSDAGMYQWTVVDDPEIPEITDTFAAMQVKLSYGGCDRLMNVTSCLLEGDNGGCGGTTQDQDVVYYGQVVEMPCAGNVSNIITTVKYNDTSFLAGSATVCRPTFTKHIVSASVNASSGSFMNDPAPAALDRGTEVSPTNGSLLIGWLDSTIPSNGLAMWPWHSQAGVNTTDTDDMSSWMHLIKFIGELSYEDMLDSVKLASASTRTFEDIFPYVAPVTYLVSAQNNMQGQARVQARRIVALDASFRILQGALAFLAIAATTLSFIRPKTRLPSDPASLASLATIVTADSALARLLLPLGSASEKRMTEELKQASFRAREVDGRYGVTTDSFPTSDEVIECDREPTFWKPVILHPLVKAVIVCLLVATIAALEILLRRDRKHHGLADYDSRDRSNRYFWSYISPVVLLVIGAAIGALDFNTRAVAQYASLHKRPQSARTLAQDLIHHGPATITWTALRQGERSVAIGTLALIFVQAAKILVAGIFVTDTVTHTAPMTFEVNSSFNTAFDFAVDSEGLYLYYANDMLLALTEIDSYGMAYPNWTTSDYAIGDVDLSAAMSLSGGSEVYLRVPVLEADLFNCRNLTYTFSQISDQWVQIDFPEFGDACSTTIELPDGAGYFGDDVATCWQEMWIFGEASAPNNGSSRELDSYVLGCNYSMTSSSMLAHISVSNSSFEILSLSDQQNQTNVDTFQSYMPELSSLGNLSAIDFVPSPGNNSFGQSFWMEMMQAKHSDVPLSEWDIDTFTNWTKSAWRTYWALFASQSLRVPFNATDPARKVLGTYTYSQTRIMMDEGPTRALEGLLGAALLAVIVVSVTIPSTSFIPSPPFSIAARMSLLAGSRFSSLRSLQDGAAQSLNRTDLEKLLTGYWVRLGWWTNDDGYRRYGIDICLPDDSHIGTLKS